MNSQNNSSPVCETTLTGFYPSNKYDCPRCGEFILTGSLQAELPGKLSGGIHQRALMSHKLRRMARDGQPPPKISTYTVDSFWTNEVMPTPAEQADDLILWVGDNQLSPDQISVVIEFGASPIHARMRASLARLDEGTFTEGHELDRKTERQVPKGMNSTTMSQEEAKRSLAKFE